jgi:hypothetical protein
MFHGMARPFQGNNPPAMQMGYMGMGGEEPSYMQQLHQEQQGMMQQQQGQGLPLVHVRAQLEQLQDTFRVKLGYAVDRRSQVELILERV